jgi:hypothetical protein
VHAVDHPIGGNEIAHAIASRRPGESEHGERQHLPAPRRAGANRRAEERHASRRLDADPHRRADQRIVMERARILGVDRHADGVTTEVVDLIRELRVGLEDESVLEARKQGDAGFRTAAASAVADFGAS